MHSLALFTFFWFKKCSQPVTIAICEFRVISFSGIIVFKNERKIGVLRNIITFNVTITASYDLIVDR